MNLKLEQLLHQLEVFHYHATVPETCNVLAAILGEANLVQLLASLDLVEVAARRLRRNPDLASREDNSKWIDESYEVLLKTRTTLKNSLLEQGLTEVII